MAQAQDGAVGDGTSTAEGTNALHSLTSGTDNTATGGKALYNNIASYNTATGCGTLYNN
jgi:hypothetical protein